MDGSAGDKACVLVSGGVESSALLADAVTRYVSVTPIYVRNHLRWEDVEIFWLKKFLRSVKAASLQPPQILEMNMRDLYEGHWSITGLRVPGAQSPDEDVYLAGRNVVLCAKVGCYAALKGIGSIEIGVLKSNPFSDSTPQFFKKMSESLTLGLGQPVQIKAPFQKLKKEEVLMAAKKLPLELTFSCINPKGYDHCGDCNKCLERKKAFFAAGIFDKTKYKKAGLSA